MVRSSVDQARTLGVMSEITTRIQAYVDGGRQAADWDALRDWLSHHTYVTPQRYVDPGSGTLDEQDWDVTHVDGSWDEVLADWAAGLLTNEQLTEVAGQIHAQAGR